MAVVAVLGMSLGPALSMGAPATAQPAVSVPDEAPDEGSASIAAKRGNKSVLVESKTDETTEVRANPNGTFTWKQHVRPVRVNRDGRWIPVDTTLVRAPNGLIRPAATVVDLELSAGGTSSAARGPLVTAAKDGAEVGLDWDGDLPEPVLSGATATYADVLPSVDLIVTADVLGFSEVLVIKTPEAARDPRLKKITFGSHAKGLTVAAKTGALTASNPSGNVIFTGDASRMWDSSGAAGEWLSGTGLGTRRAEMGVEAAGGALAIVPDQAFLADPNTRYPVYLDPSYRCQTCRKVSHAVVQSAFPTAENYNKTDGKLSDLKAGWVCETEANGGCPRISRTYFHMNTSDLAGKYIFGAYLHAVVINSYQCDGAATPTQLYWTGGIHQHTSWANQPGWIQYLSSNNRTNNSGHCPSDGGMDLDAGPAIVEAARIGAPETGFMLKGEDEGGNSSWRRFDLNPYLVVDYNSRPGKPDWLGMEGHGPGPSEAIPCVVGANRPFLPTRTPRVRARVSDVDGGTLNAAFHVLRGTKDNSTWDGNRTTTNGIPSGSFAEVRFPGGVISADGIYNWNMFSSDNQLDAWSEQCEFEVDTIKPGNPTVRSDQYPDGKSAGGVGQTGTFNLTASTATTDTAYYLYSLTEQGGTPSTKVTPSTLNGSVAVQWTPTLSGPQTLRVIAVDRAGNQSAPIDYRVVVSDLRVGVSGKVANWSLESSLADTSGAKSLSYQGPPFGPVYGPGHEGQAVVLNPDYTEFYRAKDALVRTDTSYTVSARVRLDRNDRHYVVASQDGDRVSGFYLHYNVDQNRWVMSTSDRDNEVGAVPYVAASANPPILGEWTHLTGVFDAQARKLRLYVNGTVSEADVPTPAWNAMGQFIVGAGKTAGQRQYHFAGAIDTMRVYARALTAAEVAALYAGTNTANPTAEYLFENNLDNSGANNNLLQPPASMSYVDAYAAKGIRFATASGPGVASSGPAVSTTGSFSVAAWVKLDDKAGYYHIAGQDANRASGFLFRYSTDVDRWIFGMPKEDTDVDTVQWVLSDSIPQVGVWTHIAAVHDASTHKIFLYVNGRLEKERVLVATIASAGPFVVGCTKWQGGRTGQFKGSIDEVNVYDGALRADEVATLANVPVERARYALNETTGTVAHDSVSGAQAPMYGYTITWGQNYGAPSARFSGSSTEQAGTTAGPDPVARWDLNNRLTDMSGGGFDLVHLNDAGSTPVTYTGGRINEGVQLNGIDQRMRTNVPVLDTSRSYSVAAWVKLDRDNGFFTVAGQIGNSGTPFYLQYSDDIDRWTFAMVSADQATNVTTVRAPSTLPPLLGQWTHLLGVYDAASGRARLYVNGRLEGDVAATTAWRANGGFTVGRGNRNGGPVELFPGGIDEVRVYDRALGAADAIGLWNLGSDFTMPRPSGFRTDQSFTIAGWARSNGYDATARTVIASDADRYSAILITYRPEWRRWAATAITGTETAPGTGWVLSDNEASSYEDPNGWVHLAAVYDASARKLRLYVNGLAQSTVPTGPTTWAKNPNAGSNITVRDSGRDLLIGRIAYTGGAVGHWKGAIRDVRLFSGVLPENCDNGAPNCLSQLPWQ